VGQDQRFLAVGIDVREWPCLVVGGGRVGTRKALALSDHGARVTILSPEITPRLRAAVRRELVAWQAGTYRSEAIAGFRFVVAASSSAVLNRRIGEDAEEAGVLHCVVSEAERSQVIFPAVHESDEFTLAVHTSGRSPRCSVRMRDRLVHLLDRESPPSTPLCGRTTPRPVRPDREGRVHIVGAGPGAVDLLTIRALRAIRSAHLVIYDRILGKDFAERIGLDPALTQMEWLGAGHGGQERQTGINQRMLEAARAGLTVARVKAGDPFVFGRGAEEIDFLAAHGIDCDITPGISSALGVLSSAGYALTTRGQGRSFAVTSAQLAGGVFNEHYPKADSLIVLMAVECLSQVVNRLQAEGWPPDTPAVIVERGTHPGERQVWGQLHRIADLAGSHEVQSPAVLAVGVVASRRLDIRRPMPTRPGRRARVSAGESLKP
jgi:uroporphyrin-III C-methyltransferase/precorrin-2 dehydrogenase/sirohydrochlorin ferrochelatase